MTNKIYPIVSYNTKLNNYLPYVLDYDRIYQLEGLEIHIQKRHPECMKSLSSIPDTIHSPDYIGINSNELVITFELVKTFQTTKVGKAPDTLVRVPEMMDTPPILLFGRLAGHCHY